MYYDPSGRFALTTLIILGLVAIGVVAGFGTAMYIDYKDDGQIFNGSVEWYDYLGAMVLGGVIGGLIGYFAAPVIAGLLTSTETITLGMAFAGGLGSTGGAIAISTLGEIALAGAITSVGALSASIVMLYAGNWPGDDPTKAPEGFEWRGNGAPGSSQGNWYNPSTGEILHPDLNHPQPIGPHWDFRDILRKWWRIFKNGKFPK